MTDVSGVGSQVVGIAGMGISLGLLAGMSRGVMDTMYPYSRRRRQPVRQPRKRPPIKYNRPYRPRPYRGTYPRYAWR